MEPPAQAAGALPLTSAAPAAAAPAAAAPAAAAPAAAAPAPRRYLLVRARADRRVVIGAVICGALFDVAVHSGPATIAVTGWLIVIAAAILLSGRTKGLTSKLLIGSGAVLGLLFSLRETPWVLVPAGAAIALVFLLGVSLGADGTSLSAPFPALVTRITYVFGHLIIAPGMFRMSAKASTEDEAAASKAATARRVIATARGALIAVPIMLVVGVLLAAADPIFKSWLDVGPLMRHVLFILIGSWVVVGLLRAASAQEPASELSAPPSLGTIEASLVLGGLCALYAVFAIAQLTALSGAGHRILVTQGLTYAQYARSGFFQLLACAAITLLVLLIVRSCAKAGPVLMGLSGLTVLLTIGIVVVAFRRLELYEAAFGLTMLRLACFLAAAWIGLVFVLLGLTIPARGGLPARHFPAAFVISGLVLVAVWGAVNPASIVARTDLDRAVHGTSFDVDHLVSLGPDAVPALLRDLGGRTSWQAKSLRNEICEGALKAPAGTSFNLAQAEAANARAGTCGAGRRGRS